jgi:hypothetical protein
MQFTSADVLQMHDGPSKKFRLLVMVARHSGDVEEARKLSCAGIVARWFDHLSACCGAYKTFDEFGALYCKKCFCAC